MKFSNFLAKCNRRLLMLVVAGGALTQISFSGCDQQLRDTLLTGVESSLVGLVTVIINAFFQALMAGSQTSQPVVQAIADFVPTLT